MSYPQNERQQDSKEAVQGHTKQSVVDLDKILIVVKKQHTGQSQATENKHSMCSKAAQRDGSDGADKCCYMWFLHMEEEIYQINIFRKDYVHTNYSNNTNDL